MTGQSESDQGSAIGGLASDTNTLLPVKSKRNQARFAYFAVLIVLCVYWALLFYGTHTRLPPGILPANSDKLVHFAAYAGLGALLISLRALRGKYLWTSVVGRWIVLAVYGAIDELTQMFVNRTTDLDDWYADIMGGALGLSIVTLVLWRFGHGKKASN